MLESSGAMRGSKAVHRAEDRYEADALARSFSAMLNELEFPASCRAQRVLLKPNCTGLFAPEAARTTHPAVVEALALALRQRGAEVLIGESPSVGIDSLSAFAITGIAGVAEKLNLELVDFKSSRHVQLAVPDGKVLKSVPVPEEILSADYVFSIAKLKTNYVSTISGTMKNLKGMLPDSDKRAFHHLGVAESVAGLYAALQGKVRLWGVIDGIVGSELNEPRSAGSLVAATDLLLADLIAARVMGIDPSRVKHLECAAAHRQAGIEELSAHIDLSGLPSASPPFTTEAPGIHAMATRFGVEISCGEACSGCLGALYHSLRKISLVRPELLKGLRIRLGTDLEISSREKTIYFGRCAMQQDEPGNVRGCPPRSDEFEKAINETAAKQQRCQSAALD